MEIHANVLWMRCGYMSRQMDTLRAGMWKHHVNVIYYWCFEAELTLKPCNSSMSVCGAHQRGDVHVCVAMAMAARIDAGQLKFGSLWYLIGELLSPHTYRPPVWPCIFMLPLFPRLSFAFSLSLSFALFPPPPDSLSICPPLTSSASFSPLCPPSLFLPLLPNWLYKPECLTVSRCAWVSSYVFVDLYVCVCMRVPPLLASCQPCLTNDTGAIVLAIRASRLFTT